MGMFKEKKNFIYKNKTAIDFFSKFTFTREDNIILGRVKKSDFTDLEDALHIILRKILALISSLLRIFLILKNLQFLFTIHCSISTSF